MSALQDIRDSLYIQRARVQRLREVIEAEDAAWLDDPTSFNRSEFTRQRTRVENLRELRSKYVEEWTELRKLENRRIAALRAELIAHMVRASFTPEEVARYRRIAEEHAR